MTVVNVFLFVFFCYMCVINREIRWLIDVLLVVTFIRNSNMGESVFCYIRKWRYQFTLNSFLWRSLVQYGGECILLYKEMAIFIYSELLLVTIIGALITFEMLYKVKKKRKDWLVGLNSFIRTSIHCAIEFFNCRLLRLL